MKVVTNPQYSNIKNNYEISFDSTTEIRPCQDDASVGQITYDFVKIREVNDKAVNSTIGIVSLLADLLLFLMTLLFLFFPSILSFSFLRHL